MAAIPTSTTDRHHLLDALRGFALLGIVIANYPVMSYWIFLPPNEQALLPFSGMDHLLEDLEAILIQGKFYSIFSLLFGIGFGIFLTRGGTQRFLRRMVVLAVIGWVHLRFFWEGDILLLYALLGLTLPLFNKLRGRALLVLATALLLLPIALEYLVVKNIYTLPETLWENYANMERSSGIGREEYHGGGIQEFLTYRSVAWHARVAHIVGDHRPPKVLALFLIGLVVARSGIFRDPNAYRRGLRNTLLFGGLIGLSATLFVVLKPTPDHVLRIALLTLGTAPLALAIAAAFSLIWTKQRGRRMLHVLSPAGRMALTNYLGQTFIGQLLFTGIGLGLGSYIGLGVVFALAVAVFVLQVIFSHWWLARFQFGPFEWLWRSLTYGRVVPLRKQPPPFVEQPRKETLEQM